MSDEVLWELPDSWQWATIADLGNVVSGGTPSTKDPSYWNGEINWITPADLSGYNNKFIVRGAKSLTTEGLENSSAKLMPAGSIHFSSRAPIGYVVISQAEISTNQGFKSLIPASGIFNEYIYYYLKSAKHIAEERAGGTTFKELSGTAFSQLPVPIAPSNEQYRIIGHIEEFFSELDKGVEYLKTAQEQLKVYRQSVLKAAFEGRLTEEWREAHADQLETADQLLERIHQERENRYQQQLNEWEEAVKAWEENGREGQKSKKPSKFKELPLLEEKSIQDLPNLPYEWQWVKLGQITEVSGGVTKNSERSKFALTVPYLRVANVYANRLDLSEVHEIGLRESELSRVLLQEGDLLIVEGNGSIDQIGRVAIWNSEISPCIHQNHLIKSRPLISLNGKYILYFLLSLKGRELIKKKAATTSGLYTLSLSKVEGLSVPLIPFVEQNQIVEEIESRLSICDQLEAEIEANLKKADA